MTSTLKKSALLLTALILMLITIDGFSQTVTIATWSPTKNKLTGNSLQVEVSVNSTFELDTVYAEVLDRKAGLVYDGTTQRFKGQVSLTGLSQDTLTVIITAKDVMNNTDADTVRFIYDEPPVLVIESPTAWSVARPEVRVKAHCTDNSGNCAISVAVAGITVQNSIDTVIDMSLFEGRAYVFSIHARDNYNQSVTESPMIFTETSAYLEEYYVVPDRILDFKYNKILAGKQTWRWQGNIYPYFDYSWPITDLAVTSVADNSVDTIPFTGYIHSGLPKLTPYGAIFGGSTDPDPSNFRARMVYDWNQGVLTIASDDHLSSSIKTAGDYAVWSQALNNRMRRRNLALKQNSPLDIGSIANYHSADFDVVENGSTVVKVEFGSVENIAKFDIGGLSYITDSPVVESVWGALTDGDRVVYKRTKAGSVILQLYENGITYDIVNLGIRIPEPHKQYQINSKFVAFTKTGAAGVWQLWIRDSSRKEKQVTFFGTESILDKLGIAGDMMFTTKFDDPTNHAEYRRFWVDTSGNYKHIMSGDFGTPFQYNNEWFIAIGKALYKVNLNAQPGSVTNSEVGTVVDSTYAFNKGDFAAQFDGDGNMLNIKITSLPANGQLLLGSTVVTVGTVISRLEINSLTYTPGAGYTGTDSIKWNATNGIGYAPSDAIMVVRVTATLQEPAITGLSADYCSAMPQQKGKLTNLPASANGVIVSVKLDDNALTVAADSTFSFDVNALAAGAHKIEVKYNNIAAIKTFTHNFTITAAVNPDVNISSNITTITSLSTPILITAFNAAGGGTSPLYTFARDRNLATPTQNESVNNTWTFDASTLAMGDNKIYVRMKSNASCVVTNTVLDSLVVVRTTTTGITDPDLPGQVINIFPNPFNEVISINGLSSSKTYMMRLFNMDGKLLFSKKITGRSSITLPRQHQANGTYWLSLYDEKKGHLLGTVRMVKQ